MSSGLDPLEAQGGAAAPRLRTEKAGMPTTAGPEVAAALASPIGGEHPLRIGQLQLPKGGR
jgi:hypothetical protein